MNGDRINKNDGDREKVQTRRMVFPKMRNINKKKTPNHIFYKMVDSIALSSLLVLFGCVSLLTKIRKKNESYRIHSQRALFGHESVLKIYNFTAYIIYFEIKV